MLGHLISLEISHRCDHSSYPRFRNALPQAVHRSQNHRCSIIVIYFFEWFFIYYQNHWFTPVPLIIDTIREKRSL